MSQPDDEIDETDSVLELTRAPQAPAAAPVYGPVKVKLSDKDGGAVLTLPTPMLSITQVTQYLKCPMQYEQRYIFGRKTPPGIALIEGSSNHAALEWANLYQMSHGRIATPKQVIEVFGDDLSVRAREVPADEWRKAAENRNVVFGRGVAMLSNYLTLIAPTITPVAAEEGFTMTVRGLPFQGFIDLVEGDTLWDYKVVGPSSPYLRPANAMHDLQLTAYSYAKKVKDVGFIPLVKGRNTIVPIRTKRGRKDYVEFEETVLRVAKAISAGAFPPVAPGSWACSQKFCGYYGNTCFRGH